MTTERATTTLTTYITDMHALIVHSLQVFERQLDNLRKKGHPEALAAVGEFQRTLQGHLTLLDARARALGGSTAQPVKDAITTVTGFAAGLINAVRPEEAAKSIRDDYTGLSHVAISFLMLHATAKGLGDDETASIAETGYRDAARLVMMIDRIMPALVIAELRQDGLTVADVSEASRAMVHQAWQREASDQGFGAS